MIHHRHRTPFATLVATTLLAALAEPVCANQLSLPQVSLPREGSAVLSLSFTPADESVAALQFELEYDRSAVELIATIGDATRFAQKGLYFADVSPSKRRFIIYGANQTPFQPGSLIDFIVGAAADAPQKAYPVKISNVTVSTREGFPLNSTVTDGGITITSGTGSRLSTANVRSAASLRLGPLAPGEIVTLFGSGIGPATSTVPNEGVSSPVLGGISVWFGALRAPLMYADQSQISAAVPFAITGESANVQVQKNGSVWGTAPVPIQPAMPSIFTVNWSGAGGGAVLNEDATVNDIDHPAARGSIVSLFATGAGQMNPPGVDGAVGKDPAQLAVLPVKVTVGGMGAEVLYAGEAPGLIQGIVQVNARIPANAPVGPAVEIGLEVGDVRSPAGVTLAIR